MVSGTEPQLAEAYAFCRAVARREAKNFYWAFRVLPQAKSDAMCAVYAFMRKADDLADDESMSLDQRRAAMHAWTAAWHGSQTESTKDPVFVALNDTQRRFGISAALLDQLVAGTTMDLQPEPAGVALLRTQPGQDLQVYETFDALYRYCYLVASVVGLVCIRIFGYTDARAEQLAEHTGVAFQLTNILRDVREDAERGRVYLPLDDLALEHLSVAQLLNATQGAAASKEALSLLSREIARAEAYYQAGYALIPLLDQDAQPAMRVLLTIYHRLLQRIAKDPGAVFGRRVAVPTTEKLLILGRGLAASLLTRQGA